MNWTEPKPPTQGISYYDHVQLETPIGTFLIEWKSWKERDDYAIILNSDIYIGVESTLDDAKERVKQYLIEINNKLNETIKPL